MNDYYITYKIKKGDTVNRIAHYFNASIPSIISANPLMNPFILEDGAIIIVPSKRDIVTSEKPYDYHTFKEHLMVMKIIYPFIDVDLIGLSVAQRDIYAVTFGRGEHCVIYNASHHGNEWITSMVLMKWLETLCFTHSLKGSIRGYAVDELFDHYRIILVPMVNPDGVDLVIHGLNSVKRQKERLLFLNHRNEDFSDWKANINGVDLNRNYDAGWNAYKKLEPKFKIYGPCPAGFAGFSPLSEPESLCLTNLTTNNNPRLTLSYHAQGEEIFWKYANKGAHDSVKIAKALASASGYQLANETIDQAYAGYKDWFLHRFDKPGFTIEVGRGKNPLDRHCLNEIYERNEELLLLATIM